MTADRERILAAYGGRDVWTSGRSIRTILETSGPAFGSRGFSGQYRLRLDLSIQHPAVDAELLPSSGIRSRLRGQTLTLLGPDSGRHSASLRELGATTYDSERLPHRWSLFEFMYFVSFAAWNYLCFPALLMHPNVSWHNLPGYGLLGAFGSSLPTHSREQRYWFDPVTMRLTRHDYVAQAIGPWAVASNHVVEHCTSGPAVFAATRVVTPRLGRWSARWLPKLVRIRFSECELSRAPLP